MRLGGFRSPPEWHARVLGVKFQGSGPGFRGWEYETRIALQRCTECSGFHASCSVFRVSVFVFRVSYFVFRVSCFVFRVTYFVSRVTYFVFRVSSSGFRVPFLGFGVLDFGFATLNPNGGRYRGTSLVRNRHPVGPYSRTMLRPLWRS